MDILQIARSRKATKAYDRNFRLSNAQLADIKSLLQLSPSSTNSQPWHFIIANTETGRALCAQSCAPYPANAELIKSAALVVVFCRKLAFDQAYLEKLVQQEAEDGRFQWDPIIAERSLASKSLFWNIHKTQIGDEGEWLERQVYLNLGQFLLGVAAMGIDATPIEGFDQSALNEILELPQKGLAASVLVALGRAAADDLNQSLPKSRLGIDEIIDEI